jgi:hypothetical protein
MSAKIYKTAVAMYRVSTENPIWYILDNGQFANCSEISIFSKEEFWTYDGKVLRKIKDAALVGKKLAILSLEFQYKNIIVEMEDFFDTIKCYSDEEPPFSVIMACYSIYTKTFYPWTKCTFSGFSKSGNTLEFMGNNFPAPEKTPI